MQFEAMAALGETSSEVKPAETTTVPTEPAIQIFSIEKIRSVLD